MFWLGTVVVGCPVVVATYANSEGPLTRWEETSTATNPGRPFAWRDTLPLAAPG